MRSVIVLGCLLALPMFGQTTDTTGTMSKTTTTTTKTTTTTTKKHVTSSHMSRTKVFDDATRLAALLNDSQNTANFSDATWKTVANEANMLANRIYSGSGGRAPAKDIRSHVREMREAALKGDAAGARSHASLALPFVYQIIDWSSPKA